MIQASRAAFAGVDREMEEAALTLGRRPWEVFLRVTLPLARRTLLVGLALSSARALGDFGVTLMVAGNIPGRTQTLPLFIYGQVESLNLARAHVAALLLVGVGIASLCLVRRLESGAHERLA
jgi:molybdate transport system permease protein